MNLRSQQCSISTPQWECNILVWNHKYLELTSFDNGLALTELVLMMPILQKRYLKTLVVRDLRHSSNIGD